MGCDLNRALTNNIQLLQPQGDKDIWTYNWGNTNFTASRAYKEIIGHRVVHPLFSCNLEIQVSDEAQGILLATLKKQTEY